MPGLHRFLNSARIFTLCKEGDWGAGGCWTLAEALADFLGPEAVVMAVSEQRTVGGKTLDIPVSHLVVRMGDVYIDYLGVQTRTRLFKNLVRDGYQRPVLQDFGPALRQQAEREFTCDPVAKSELVKRLRQRYG
jgi:hypothetical protein